MLTPGMRWGDLLFFVLALALCASAEAAGGGGLPSKYLTSDERGQPPSTVRAWAQMEPTSFAINSVEKKYRLVPLVLENKADTPLVLSATQDRVTMVTRSGEKLSGSLQLAKLDRALWDSWDNDVHEALAYPQSVPPKSSRLIFVFVPASKLARVPDGVDFTVASLGQTLQLRSPPAMAD